MANPARNAQISCFVCGHLGRLQQMPRIGNNIDKNQIAIIRRAARGFDDVEIEDATRICFNCNQSIQNELEVIENDPTHLRLNVLNQRQNRACVICGAIQDTTMLSPKCRSHVFIQANIYIYIPNGVRCCANHLNEVGHILQPLILGLNYINRPYVIPGADLQSLLENMRQAAHVQDRLFNPDKLSEEEFRCLFSMDKAQFEDLLTFCDPVPRFGELRYIHSKDLMTFLCKMRQGLSDEFLSVVFNYSTRQAVSLAIHNVRLLLMSRFTPNNVGISAISRETFIANHVTPFANELYNSDPEVLVAVTVCDATYAYIHKSSNFRILRQSYSMHKGRHLLKPTLIVAPDGYILSILGPYFSDSENNDADILRSEFERDTENLRDWFQDGDIMLVDRGYRDVTPLLTRLGIEHKMPAFLERGQRQFTTEEANENHIITKVI